MLQLVMLIQSAQYLDVPLRAAFVTAADTTNGMRASFGQSCIAEQGAYYMVRPALCCPHDSVRWQVMWEESCCSAA